MSSVWLASTAEIDDDDDDEQQYQQQQQQQCSISEIEEVDEDEMMMMNNNIPTEIKQLFGFGVKRYLPMPSIKEQEQEYDHEHDHDDVVYVGVGKSQSSMDALTWTLNHYKASSTVIYLIHVFPEIKYIPSPLGKLPKSQVSSEQVKNYMAQESGNRRDFLQKYLDTCSAAKVKVDTMLIESDMIGKAILDLIPILNITKLVLGTTKSNIRKLMSRKGSGIADQILEGAPETCEIKIVCEGNEVMIGPTIESPLLSPLVNANANANDDHDNPKSMQHQDQRNDAVSCICFKSKFSYS